MDVLNDRDYFRRLGIAYDVQGLVAVLHSHKPKSAMPLACHSLADMGALEALPVLKELADFPVQDVKATSVLAVARLCGAEATDWLTECLARKGTLKSYVLWALAAVADPRAYPAVKAWAAPLIRKVERRPEKPALSSLVFDIAYLEQVTQIHPEAIGLLERFEAVARTLPPGELSEFRSFTRMFARKAATTGPAPNGLERVMDALSPGCSLQPPRPGIDSTGPSAPGALHEAP
ncbi:MAG: HEAT repeat domain-containing protein [Pseudomonadota bacterium]